MSDWAAVENPLVSRGIAIICWALIHTIWQVVLLYGVGVQAAAVGSPPIVVCASANARTTNRSLPASPSSRSGAWFEYTVKVSSPEPPTATRAWEFPALSQPRVVGTVAKTSCGVSEPPLVSRVLVRLLTGVLDAVR